MLTKACGADNARPGRRATVPRHDIAENSDGTDQDSDDDQAPTHASPPREWYGDSAYGTGDLCGAINDAGHQAVIKPKPVQPAVNGGFTIDDFTVDDFTVDETTRWALTTT